jgi:hypothetical protein
MTSLTVGLLTRGHIQRQDFLRGFGLQGGAGQSLYQHAKTHDECFDIGYSLWASACTSSSLRRGLPKIQTMPMLRK